MNFITVALIAAIVFGACFLADRGFSSMFRGTPQHHSGKSVRLNKRYGSFGLIIMVVGIGADVMIGNENLFILICGILLILLGAAMITYYMTFGIYYDSESFLVASFGRKSVLYRYNQIEAQQLYIASGNTIVELHIKNGGVVQVHGAMTGVYEFLDYAYGAWLRQTGRKEEDCPFHDPDNSCWFPPVED